MLVFFRKIRQKFLKEGKLASYLTYALGEIVLVVIGILIALWLNNLNQKANESEQRRQLKMALIEELEENREICKDFQSYLNVCHQKMVTIINISAGQPTSLPVDSIRVLVLEMIPAKSFGLNDSRIQSAKAAGLFSLLTLKENDAVANYERMMELFKESRNLNQVFTKENREFFTRISLIEEFHRQIFPNITLKKHPDYILSDTEFLTFLKQKETYLQTQTLLTSILVDHNWVRGLQTDIDNTIKTLSVGLQE